MPNQNLDPETMPLDELRALANQQIAEGNPSPAAPAAQPRDEKGRFAKTEDELAAEPESAEVEDEPSGEPDQVIYQREIDLGDGSGVQVFRADSLEELVDKLAEAQRNATRKIRELNQTVKSQQQPTPQPDHQLSDDEEFLIAQGLMAKPSDAFKKLFRKTVGVDINDFKSKLERVAAFEKAQAENAAAQQFIAAHPDYVVSPANGERLVNYLQTYRLDCTPENLERAYNDLGRSGLLEVKAQDEPEVPASPVAPPAAPVAPAPRAPQRRASGISARRAPVASPRTEPTEDELYSMPLNQLRELANRQSREE